MHHNVSIFNWYNSRWWGKGEGGDDDISLKPFTFTADNEQLEDLKIRIKYEHFTLHQN